MEQQGYSIVRPIEYNTGRFQPGLTESAVNIFRMSYEPTDFSESRASWQFRSPGLNSLMSSQVFIEFDLEIITPSKYYDFASALGANYALVQVNAAGGNQNDRSLGKASVTLAFGEGNPFKACQQSYQLVVNGASLQQTRMDEWSNSVEKLWLPPKVMQRRFGRCGGAWSNWDGVAVSGSAFAPASNATFAASGCVAGFTQDSALAKRISGLYACTKQATAVTGTQTTRVVRVRCPVEGCGIFNPLGRGDQCSNSCPLKSSSFVIPHMNVIGLNLLFKNMFKTIIKNLGGSMRAGGGNINATGDSDVTVRFPVVAGASKPNAKLLVSYIRLPSWRSIPQTRTLASYRMAVHDATSKKPGAGLVVIPAVCHDGAGTITEAIPVAGTDFVVAVGATPCAQWNTTRYLESVWSGIQMSQIPSFVLQKTTDLYTLATGTVEAVDYDMTASAQVANNTQQTAGLNNQALYRNTAASAAIVGLKLQIQSSVGSYEFSPEYPHLKGRSELFADTIKNSYLEYCDGCEYNWDRHSGIVFLQSSDFARGLSSEGASFPITIDATCRFENHRQYCDGTGYASLQSLGPAVLRDVIAGRPLMLALYSRQSLAISPSAALVSSQNISHASAIEILSRQ